MERSKNFKVFGILCLIVSVIAVSFAYSALTHTLKIEATSKTALMKNAEWNIVFENLSNANIIGAAKEVSKPRIISPTTIGGYEISFRALDEEVYYKFDVTNKGTLDAVVSSIQITTPNCIGSVSDCEMVLKNIKSTLTYADGSEIKVGDILYANKDNYLDINRKELKLKISYLSNGSSNTMPTNGVVLKNIEAVILFKQSY